MKNKEYSFMDIIEAMQKEGEAYEWPPKNERE